MADETNQDQERLTPKEERFCLEYIRTLNGASAALAAGYCSKRLDAVSASNYAYKLLRRPKIANRIEALKLQRSMRMQISADRVLEEWARIAFLDPAQLFDEAGHLRRIQDLPEEVRAALASIELEDVPNPLGGPPTRTAKLKMADKVKALEMLSKHLGLYKETVKVEYSLADLVTAAIKADEVGE